MALRSFDPITDQALMERDQERTDARSQFQLKVDDTIELTVDGAKYTVWVEATLSRNGSAGPIELSRVDIREIYIHVGGFKEPLQLVERSFRVMHRLQYDRLDNAVDFYLLNLGLASSDWKAA
jgi:hypothetical protein